MESALLWFTQSTPIFLLSMAVLGLLIGSFLNVVIYRLPIMLKREWLAHCYEFIQEMTQTEPPAEIKAIDGIPTNETFNLIKPDSRCPRCQHKIGALENIPVISFLVLRGRCLKCKQSISWRYPGIEVLTSLVTVVTAAHFGPSIACIFALILTWSLLALFFIDLDHMLLPDEITMPLLWLGLAVNMADMFTTITNAIVGAMFGYLFLWIINRVYKCFSRIDGIGHGDFKLLALLGAWMGIESIIPLITIAAFAGTIFALIMILLKRLESRQAFAFGPFIALSGWVCLIWKTQVATFYNALIHVLGIAHLSF